MLFVLGLIDSTSNSILEDVRNKAETLGTPIQTLYAHITFATYVGNDDASFVASCKELLREYKPFTVRYEKIEKLPNTSILAAFPSKEKELAAIHKHIVETWKDSLTTWTLEEIWQPHTTLLNNMEIDLENTLHTMQSVFTPFDAKISRIEFSSAHENGFEIIDSVELM